MTRAALKARVERTVATVRVTDIHTHLYDPAFGDLLLWGIDDLLVYHYLVAEAFRHTDISYDKFWSLSKTQQADLIWDALFLQHSPISESCRGVLTTLNAFGLDVKKRDLPALRKWFAGQKPGKFVTRCMDLAGVEQIYMTNSPFDDIERPVWEKGFERDERFLAALRIDPLLLAWNDTSKKLGQWGYKVSSSLTPKTISQVRKFLCDWTQKMDAQYLMVSLPPDFNFPEANTCNRLLEEAVLPHCREFNLPFAVMPGVRRAVNPQLGLAGDGIGVSNMAAFNHLFAKYPENRFLATMLSRENQHELCVAARKFRNLHIFGCWWFTNVPHLIEEITRLRLELVGLSITPQHSDARVLDQIIYKWRHNKEIIGRVLVEKYEQLAATGWQPTSAEIERDVRDLFGGAFKKFCG
ncbi:MAG: glucuronate isomerase [Verrucomicrobia bacterium]|nr:glucuronate isomerase [Verrucomicrobiota bacterium]